MKDLSGMPVHAHFLTTVPGFTKVILSAQIFRGDFTGWKGHECTCQVMKSENKFEKSKKKKTNFIYGPVLVYLLQHIIYILEGAVKSEEWF